jgi:hypothetical protein
VFPAPQPISRMVVGPAYKKKGKDIEDRGAYSGLQCSYIYLSSSRELREFNMQPSTILEEIRSVVSIENVPIPRW